MKNKLILSGLSLVVLINGTFISGMYLGNEANISIAIAISASIMAIASLLGLIGIGIASTMAVEAMMEKADQIHSELKALKQKQEEVQASTLKERVENELAGKNLSRKATKPVRSHRFAAGHLHSNPDVLITSI